MKNTGITKYCCWAFEDGACEQQCERCKLEVTKTQKRTQQLVKMGNEDSLRCKQNRLLGQSTII